LNAGEKYILSIQVIWYLITLELNWIEF
jgi:hypothetical protein